MLGNSISASTVSEDGPGESSVLSASPVIGGLLLYSVYDSASAESIVHLPPPAVNYTLPEARQNMLNSEDRTNKEVKSSSRIIPTVALIEADSVAACSRQHNEY
jgi:hypothetical protein